MQSGRVYRMKWVNVSRASRPCHWRGSRANAILLILTHRARARHPRYVDLIWHSIVAGCPRGISLAAWTACVFKIVNRHMSKDPAGFPGDGLEQFEVRGIRVAVGQQIDQLRMLLECELDARQRIRGAGHQVRIRATSAIDLSAD